MLGGPTVKQLWELAGQQHSIRAIARELGLSRNIVGNNCGRRGSRGMARGHRAPRSWTRTGTTFAIASPPASRMASCCFASCGRRATPAATRS